MISSPIGPRDQLLDVLSCQNFDLSMGYRQIKSEPTMFVMLSYPWLFPRADTIISFWSDRCYNLVHIVLEFHVYGTSINVVESIDNNSILSMIHVEHLS